MNELVEAEQEVTVRVRNVTLPEAETGDNTPL